MCACVCACVCLCANETESALERESVCDMCV
jgi:hypothetical protein